MRSRGAELPSASIDSPRARNNARQPAVRQFLRSSFLGLTVKRQNALLVLRRSPARCVFAIATLSIAARLARCF